MGYICQKHRRQDLLVSKTKEKGKEGTTKGKRKIMSPSILLILPK